MRLPVPASVLEKFAHGIREGRWEGWGVILDIVGFTAFTEELERTYGSRGLERLVDHLREAYGEIFSILRDHGGEVVQFTGDGLIAWIGDQDRTHAETLLKRLFASSHTLVFRGALLAGPLRWTIVEHGHQALYVIFGEAFFPDHWIALPRTSISPSEGPSDSPPAFPAPRAFWRGATNHDLVSRFLPFSVLSGPDEGAFRDVAVVFLLLDHHPLDDPEEDARTLLDAAKEAGGWIARMGFSEKGLEALVLFGAPRAREGMIRRAQTFVARVRERMGERIRGGLSTGQVFAGWVGGERGEYTVMGSAVNRAAHLALEAPWGTVREELSILHRSAPLPGVSPPFIGREEAFEALENALKRMVEHGPSVILITGPPGIGKSRFLEEAVRRLLPHRAFLIQADPDKPPLEPLLEFLERWIGARPGAPSFTEAVPRLLELRSSAGSRLRSRLHDLLKPGVQESLGTTRWLVDLVEILVHLTKDEGPLILAVDDIPWLDHASLEVIRGLLSRNGLSLGLWATAPGSGDVPIGKISDTLRLAPFTRREIRRFVSSFLEGPPDPSFVALLEERSGGNPLFLEHILLYLLRAGKLVKDRGFWKPEGEVTHLPFRIREVILARFDQLDTHTQEVLCTAAVAGNRWKLAWLERLFSLQDVDTAFFRASETGFLRVHPPWGKFTHAMIRNVLQEMQTSRARARRHLALAGVLEDEDPVLAALHRFHAWELGQGKSEEVRHRLQRALEQTRGKDPHLVLNLLEALETLDISPEDRISAYLEKGKIHVRLGNWGPAEEMFRSAEALARRLGRSDLVVDALKERAFLSMLRGDHSGTLHLLDEAEELIVNAGDYERMAGIENVRGMVYWHQGRPLQALEAFRRTREAARRAGRSDLVIRALNNIANALDDLGHHTEAEMCYREYIQFTRRDNTPLREASGLLNLGGNLLLQERYDEAIRVLRHSRWLLQNLRHLRGLASADHNLSMALMERGQYEIALRHAFRARRIYQVLGFRKGLAMIHGVMAEIFRRTGHPSRVRTHIRLALRHARIGNVPYARAEALLVLAELLRTERRWGDLHQVASRIKHLGDQLNYPRFQFASRAFLIEARLHLSGSGPVEELRILERFARTPGDQAWILELRWHLTGDARLRKEACRLLRTLYARTGRMLYRERLHRLGCL